MINVEILHNNQPLRQIHHEGQVFAVAPKDGNYELRLTNSSYNRLLIVLSVDGVNAVDGTDAGYDGSGYVLSSRQSFVVKGWMRDHNEAAAFMFSTPEQSYAEQTGRTADNVGVIGAAVFEEKELESQHWHRVLRSKGPSWAGGPRCSSASYGTRTSGELKGLSSETFSSAAPQNLGTGYGKKVEQRTTTTSFDRKEKPSQVTAIRYATKDVLLSWGVPADKEVPSAPNPFPVTIGVPAPAGWRG